MSYSSIKFKSSGLLYETRFRDRDVFKEQIPNMVDLMQAGMASDTIAANGSNGGYFDKFLAGYAEVDGAEPVALSAMRIGFRLSWESVEVQKERNLVLMSSRVFSIKKIFSWFLYVWAAQRSAQLRRVSARFAGVGHAIAVRGYNERDKKILLNDPTECRLLSLLRKLIWEMISRSGCGHKTR